MSFITSITAREILDSRGNPTVEAIVTTENSIAMASVPSGASTGIHEAVELRDGGTRFLGLGVQKAIHHIEHKIAPLIKGIDCTRQQEIDSIMIDLDGTPNKRKLGANATLAVSLACAKAAAQDKNMLLFQYLHQLANTGKPMRMPRPFFNVMNGGKHADNNLSFQEFMIAPNLKTFHENLRAGSEIYHTLKRLLHQKYGTGSTNVGDEGGFAPAGIKTTGEALKLLLFAIAKAGYKNKVHLALDCAASEIYHNGKYLIDGKKMTPTQLLQLYRRLAKKYPLLSIEDPFHQDDFDYFAILTQKAGIQIVADDLTVTNRQRLEKAEQKGAGNCLLLKLNQIGTLSEALEDVRIAYEVGWNVMVSHRSGETEDAFIADLAVAIGCGQIKAGAPCRGERTAKYNQLLRIEELLTTTRTKARKSFKKD